MQREPRKTAGSHSPFSKKNVQGNQKCRPNNNQKGVQENEQDEQRKVSEKT